MATGAAKAITTPLTEALESCHVAAPTLRSTLRCRGLLASRLCTDSLATRRCRRTSIFVLRKSDCATWQYKSRRCRFSWRSTQLTGKSMTGAQERRKKRFSSVNRIWGTGIRAASADVDIAGEEIVEDYYGLLGLTPEATPEQIKKAYYGCMKVCHPDLSGDHPETTNFCKFLNEVYEVLIDPEQRAIYDEINGFTLAAINPFYSSDHPREFAFVDEFSCIGCKNCNNCAPKTFDIELDFGRARVMHQNGDPVAKVQEAIDTCPVDCIHWVTAPQLTLLEDEMRRIERVNVGVMLAGQGNIGADVFQLAARNWDKRQAKALERAAWKAAKEKAKDSKRKWWEFTTSAEDEEGGKAANQGPTQNGRKSAMERAVAAAEAARRWREYSRAGVDRRARRALPSVMEPDNLSGSKR